MRTKIAVLIFVGVVLQGLALWSAWLPDYQWLCNLTSGGAFVVMCGALALLIAHRADWRFRLPALAVVLAYFCQVGALIWILLTWQDR